MAMMGKVIILLIEMAAVVGHKSIQDIREVRLTIPVLEVLGTEGRVVQEQLPVVEAVGAAPVRRLPHIMLEVEAAAAVILAALQMVLLPQGFELGMVM
jgi:hypothetical protein